ncbi:MAG: EI24 domain-containing protein [Planctomycetes bacterium]|nr:EI24 domain-containing protein [Planctomycetota bacterium]
MIDRLVGDNGFIGGFLLPFRGAAILLRGRGVKRYAVLPLLVNAVLYLAVLALLFYLVWNWEPGTYDWQFWGCFGDAVTWTVNAVLDFSRWILVPVYLVLAALTFTSVGMVVASPFNDILSERVENLLCHPKQPVDMPLRLTLRSAILSVYDSLIITTKELGLSLLVLPLLLVPLVGAVPIFLVGAYYAGRGFVDVGMARNLLRNKHKKLLVRKCWWQVLGFGMAMQLLFLIPLLGLIFLPVGVAAGTIVYCEFDWSEAMKKAELAPPVGFIPPRIET